MPHAAAPRMWGLMPTFAQGREKKFTPTRTVQIEAQSLLLPQKIKPCLSTSSSVALLGILNTLLPLIQP